MFKNIFSPVAWLVFTLLCYLLISIINIITPFTESMYIEMIWCIGTSLPLWCKPFNYIVNVNYFWKN